MSAKSDRLLEAIRNIAEETGYPPTPDELDAVFETKQIQATAMWRDLMRTGRIKYGDDGTVAAGVSGAD